MTKFTLVVERSAAHLHSFNFPFIKELWPKVQADFLDDSVKYPTVMAYDHDIVGRKQFKMKCETICFPPESKPPCSPEE